jgi:hypothetical protein
VSHRKRTRSGAARLHVSQHLAPERTLLNAYDAEPATYATDPLAAGALVEACVVDGEPVAVSVQLFTSNIPLGGNLGWVEGLRDQGDRFARLAKPYTVDATKSSDLNLTILFSSVVAVDAPAPTAGRLRVASRRSESAFDRPVRRAGNGVGAGVYRRAGHAVSGRATDQPRRGGARGVPRA